MKREETAAAALDPRSCVVIEACAGSGKTWLLVSRIVRLLLSGAKPSEILAITFTRKAAQEMASRLREWLRILALEPDDRVREFLLDRHVAPAEIDELLAPARHLLEAHLTAEPPITLSTFHSWFLELLQRAPLDSGAVGRVTLLEQTSTLLTEAWSEFAQGLRQEGRRELAARFNILLEHHGLASTRKLLFAFVRERVRWWAYTAGQPDPVAFALGELRSFLGVDPDRDPAQELMSNAGFVAAVAELSAALARGTDAARRAGAELELALAVTDATASLAALNAAIFTKTSGAPVKNIATAAQKAGAGDAHLRVCEQMAATQAALIEQKAYALHEAALPCALALVEAYQALKLTRDGMDFADVEWRAWNLLTRSDHAEYMQYKLDARYRHVLVDEFQDTNPVQWQTLRAWLEASQQAERAPSVFLVGDPKQSIYRFRGAEARLFRLGQRYLGERFGGRCLTIPVTRRCAPAVVETVNRVFGPEPLFDGFEVHEAHDAGLAGRVEVLALARGGEAPQAAPVPSTGLRTGFRNPLAAPRPEPPPAARQEEARQLVSGIGKIVGNWVVADGKERRRARYGDILVLVRSRTHLEIYERALHAAHIPFLTSRRGGLLETLEAADLGALLGFLVTPFADLRLATALRSPIFSCEDSDLATLAAGEGPWRRRLARLAAAAQASPALARAHRLLAGWLKLVDRLPVHDLLDRIYFEGDVLRRYRDTVPEAMREGVEANLQAFVELALAVDAGRYPSLPRFLDEMASLRRAEPEDAPDEGVVGQAGHSVRILTVHGAKGLEAPIVWLLDAHTAAHGAETYRVLDDWPPEAERPRHFSLLTVVAARGVARRELFAQEAALQAREELNVLYVAMTRARQALIVSGCENGKAGDGSGYRRIAAALGAGDAGGAYGDDLATLALSPVTSISANLNHSSFKGGAGRGMEPVGAEFTPIPTGTRGVGFASHETRRGEKLHLLLQYLAPSSFDTSGSVADEMWLREMLAVDEAEFGRLALEARTILRAPELQRFFDPAAYLSARGEVSYLTAAGELRRIDRVVEFADEVWVLDYKTGEATQEEDRASLLGRYGRQLDEYLAAIRTLYGAKPVRAGLILRGGVLIVR